jgi:hypothetical protein
MGIIQRLTRGAPAILAVLMGLGTAMNVVAVLVGGGIGTVVGTGKILRRRDNALKPIARKLAVLIRGGTLKRGKKPPSLERYEHCGCAAEVRRRRARRARA